MKFNWGTGILIVIILFLLGIGSLVYISFQHKINLVYKDYYPKEIVHQQMIDRVRNTHRLKKEVQVSYRGDRLEVIFPDVFNFDEVNGNILFYRPSDFEDDVTYPIALSDSGTQNISTRELLKGKYIVKMEWEYHDSGYYFEKSIHIKK